MQSTSEPATRVILLRHGASTFNVEDRYQGCCDESLLTQEGRKSARLSGERLKSEGIAVIISSPLQRAVETAREVRAVLEQSGDTVSLVTDSRLREVDLPAWEGLHYDTVKQEFPAQVLAWRLNPSELRMPLPSGQGMFPVRSLYRRAESFWKDLVATYAGKTVLLVTHGGTARAMVTSAMGLGIDQFHRVQLSNCGIICLTVRRPESRTTIELLNDTAHLSTTLPKLKEGRTGVRLLLIAADSDTTEDYLELSCVLERVAIDRMFILNSVRSAARLVFSSYSGAERVSEPQLERNLQSILQAEMARRNLSQVVVAAPINVSRQLLECCVGLPRGTGKFLDFKPVGINAIHWPGNGVPPVLQGMNLFAKSNCLAGEHA